MSFFDYFRTIWRTNLIVQIIQLPFINPPIKDETDWTRNLRENKNKLNFRLIIKYVIKLDLSLVHKCGFSCTVNKFFNY